MVVPRGRSGAGPPPSSPGVVAPGPSLQLPVASSEVVAVVPGAVASPARVDAGRQASSAGRVTTGAAPSSAAGPRERLD